MTSISCRGAQPLANSRTSSPGSSQPPPRNAAASRAKDPFWRPAASTKTNRKTSEARLYYPTYVEDEVIAALEDPADFERGPRTTKRGSRDDDSQAFVVQDRNYLSARWPGDAYLFAKRFEQMLRA